MTQNVLTRSAVLLMYFTLIGCAADVTSSLDPRRIDSAGAAMALTTSERHGLWVYGTDWMKTEDGRDAFMRFAVGYGINNVYISLQRGGPLDELLDADELPGFLSRLYGNGIRAEALLGDARWVEADYRGAMIDRIQRIKAYNGKVDTPSRFVGIHLDVEPWINTDRDPSWIDPLIDCYETADAQLSGTPLTLVADVSGTKALLASDSQRQRMLNAVTRIVLMEYEEPRLDVVAKRTHLFLSGLQTPVDGRGVVVALRAKDFSDAMDSNAFKAHIAADLDEKLSNEDGYVGWALFQYSNGNLR
jgi:hypothetical protein